MKSWFFKNLMQMNEVRRRPARRFRRRMPGVAAIPMARVEQLEGRTLLTQIAVSTTADSGPGSLRQAILDANVSTDAAVISFAISTADSGFVDVDSSIAGGDAAADVFRIRPLSALPAINNVNGKAVTLDATTQRLFSGDTSVFGPEVVLDGSLAGAAAGLDLVSSGIVVRGLAVNRFEGTGIRVYGNNAVVAGNYVGTHATGKSAAPNGDNGVYIDGASETTIGGVTPDSRNLISGNSGIGVAVGAGAADTTILGNRIGTDATGMFAIPNTNSGISVGTHNAATNTTIGGAAVGARNVISGNGSSGIGAGGSGVIGLEVLNNYIGLNAAGNAAIPNTGQGMRLEQGISNITIGRPGAGNVISGNGSLGIGDTFVENITIQSNIIGLDATGTIAIGNYSDGISFSDARNILIGGADPSERNIVSGNAHSFANSGHGGIFVRGSNITVSGNYVGTDITGTVDLGNLGPGIRVQVTDTSDVSNNLVSGNGQSGILVYGEATGSAVLQNNLIGTNSDGTVLLPNGGAGIWLQQASGIDVIDNVSVGSLASSGLIIDASRDVTVRGNKLGVLADGISAAGNDAYGLYVLRSYDLDIADNVISANRFGGVRVQESAFEPVLVQWPVAEGGNDHWYWLTPDRRTWDSHEALAVSLGTHLVTVNSAEENTFIRDEIIVPAGVNAAWHGFNDAATEGSFAWSSGEPVTFTGWGNNEPNGGTGENYGHFYTDGTWNDVPGYYQNTGIIEFATQPDVADLVAAYGEIRFTRNMIGLGTDGVTDVGNVGSGISIDTANGVIIGGLSASDRNIISANRRGIEARVTDGLQILNNYIGTDVTGNLDRGNGEFGHDSKGIGIDLATNLVIGAPGAGNVISATTGNFGSGIGLGNSQFVTIQANRIGTNADGTAALPNNNAGIEIRPAQDVVIGGTEPGAGNVISGNDGTGIHLEVVDRAEIKGNFVGTAANGLNALGNNTGIALNSTTDVVIGGVVAEATNIISANTRDGISLFGWGHNASVNRGTVVAGNLIGVDASGSSTLGNGDHGIIANRTETATISGNVIGASGSHQVYVIGRDEDFSVTQWAIADGGNGHYYALLPPRPFEEAQSIAVSLGGHLATLTSQAEADFVHSVYRNANAPHRNDRLMIGLSDSAVEGTYEWVTGEAFSFAEWNTNEPFADQFHDYVHLEPNGKWFTWQAVQHSYALVEFETPPDFAAIEHPYPTPRFEITGNRIGVGRDGAALGNDAGDGIRIWDYADVLIGSGSEVANANVIAYNAADGVGVLGDVASATIAGNSIHSNGAQGIDLAPQGPTPNDPGDADTGPNGLQNFPVLSVETGTGVSTLIGTLSSLPNAVFTVEVYLSNTATAADAEGETLLFSTTITTDSSGIGTFSVARLPAGTTGFLTATATDSSGNTSEFSGAIAPLVEGPDLQLLDTGNVISAGATVSLGATAPGTVRTRTLTVQNTGTQNLILQPMTAPSGFTVLTNFSANQSVAPGVSVNFVVQFDATSEGTLLGSLTIPNNESAFGVTLGGTAVTGLRLVTDLAPGLKNSTPRELTAFNDRLYFLANDGIHGTELWVTDGTSVGTSLVKDINPGAEGSNIDSIVVANGVMFFTAFTTDTGNEIWRSDGTADGTTLIKDIIAGPTSSAYLSSGYQSDEYSQSHDDVIYFAADDGVTGYELWRTDGTALGTYMVKEINPEARFVPFPDFVLGGSDPGSFRDFNGFTYFNATGPDGNELWRTDGTPAGTTLVIDAFAGPDDGMDGIFSGFVPIAVFGDSLMVQIDNGATGFELWMTDGTAENTVLVRDIADGIEGSYPVFLAAVNGTVLFIADDGVIGNELYRTDGTTSGTQLVRDIRPGAASSTFTSISTAFGDSVYFFADDGVSGKEIWISDTTAVGTANAFDLNPGAASSVTFTRGISRLGNRLFFGGNDGTSGEELWVYEPFGPSTLTLEFTSNTISETGTASATISRNGLTDQQLIVTLTSSDISELTVPMSVTIPKGQSSVTFTLTGVHDQIIDGTKSVTINATATGFAGAAENLDVTDVDTTTVGIRAIKHGSETAPNDGEFEVRLSRMAEFNVLVPYSISGTGQSGSDFQTLTGTVTILAGHSTAQISVAMINDDLAEYTETLRLTLGVPTVSGISVKPTEASAQILLLDNDRAGISVTSRQVTVSESGTTTSLGVTLTAQPTAPVRVLVSFSDGGEAAAFAAGGASFLDFTPLNWNVAQTITITGIDDALIDGSQRSTVTLRIDLATTTGLFRTVQPLVVDVTTLDNEAPAALATIDSVVMFNQDAASEQRLSPEQTGQRSLIRHIEVTLNGNVVVPTGAVSNVGFQLRNIGLGTLVGLNVDSRSFSNGKTRLVFSFTSGTEAAGSLVDGNYRFMIDGAILGIDADRSGSIGGVRQTDFHRLFGDSDGDRDVDGKDLGRYRDAVFATAAKPSVYSSVFDYDNDGGIMGDLDDYLALRSRIGGRLRP